MVLWTTDIHGQVRLDGLPDDVEVHNMFGRRVKTVTVTAYPLYLTGHREQIETFATHFARR